MRQALFKQSENSLQICFNLPLRFTRYGMYLYSILSYLQLFFHIWLVSLNTKYSLMSTVLWTGLEILQYNSFVQCSL